MPKGLTDAALQKLKPTAVRREIRDGGALGLHLIIQPSGRKSWAMRFRRPNGSPAKLTLGTCDDSVRKERHTQFGKGDELPKIGGHHTLAAARFLAAEVEHKRKCGCDVIADHLATQRERRTAIATSEVGTFGKVAREFIEQHKVRRTGRRPRRWREIARVLGFDYPRDQAGPTIMKGGLAELWASKPISEISAHEIYEVVDQARRVAIPGLSPRNLGTSDSRGRKIADALGGLFAWAIRNRRNFITANPCIGGYRPNAPAARERVLNFRTDVRGADELRWFWDGCDRAAEPFGALLKLLLLTGCRLNEVARMTWDELSDDLATLRLASERTKNGRSHDVPIPPLAREILRGVKRIEGCHYVFSTNGRGPVSGFSKIKRRLDATMPEAAPWRLHDLRRTAATGMASLGIAPHVVEAALNHLSGAKAGVAGTYNREQYAGEKRAALEQWAAYVSRNIDQTSNILPLREGGSYAAA